MNCKKCGQELKLSRILFKNGAIHFQQYCRKCGKQCYVPQTEEMKEVFKNVEFKKSKKLQKLEAEPDFNIKEPDLSWI